MATNGNNLEQKFDALLGAYVKKQGATDRVACTQFDPDTAGAYLERALTKNALLAFEEHLAGCASCRRCVVELARLMPAQMVTTENVSVTTHPSFKERLSEWFTGWHLGLLAGVGVAAAAVLLVVIVVNRPTGETMMVSLPKDQIAVPQASSPLAIPSAGQTEIDKRTKPTASATPAAIARGRDATNSPGVAAPPTESQSAAAASVVPPPPAPVTKADEERKEVVANQVGQSGGIAATQNQARNYQNVTPSGPSANQAQAERNAERAKREGAAATADTAAPSSAAKPQEKAEEKDQKVEDKAATEARRDEMAARKSAYEEDPQKSARLKAAPRAPLAMITPGRTARQVKNVGSRSFRLENGLWTDTEYDASKGLPVVRLQHDSEEYKQTLKEIPGLKPYFDLKAVVVVWQGKVYRVEQK